MGYGEEDDVRLPEEGEDVRRRQLLLAALAAPAAGKLSISDLTEIEQIRRETDRVLEATNVSTSMLDRWEEAAEEYGFAFRYVSPDRLLCEIVLDLMDVRRLTARRQPMEVQRQLCHVIARLSGLAALAMGDLGDFRTAQGWFRTARAAADETGDRQLRGWVLAKEATEFLFHGRPPEMAVERARMAQVVAGPSASPALAIALSAEARGYSRMGRKNEVSACINKAEEVFYRLDSSSQTSSVHAYSERQLLFHQGDAWTALGSQPEASQVHARVLPMYPENEPLEPALIKINDAKCLARAGDIEQACLLTVGTISSLPEKYKSTVTTERSSEVLNLIPTDRRNTGAARDLTTLVSDMQKLTGRLQE